MATIWKGTLTFGLVAIPVELKAAVRPEHISFRLLHKSDLSPVKANLMKIIHAKMRGKKMPATKASRRATDDDKVIDLMARLKASLRDTGSAKKTVRKAKSALRPARTRGTARKSA